MSNNVVKSHTNTYDSLLVRMLPNSKNLAVLFRLLTDFAKSAFHTDFLAHGFVEICLQLRQLRSTIGSQDVSGNTIRICKITICRITIEHIQLAVRSIKPKKMLRNPVAPNIKAL